MVQIRTVPMYLLVLVLAISFSHNADAQTNTAASIASRYITAVQRSDFKTVVDLSDGDQSAVSDIKSRNPQALWPKLIKDFYDGAITNLKNGPKEGLLLPAAKWRVTETRVNQVQKSLFNDGPIQTVVYVAVNYPSMDDSPYLDGKLLKQTILEVDMRPKSLLIMSLKRLPQGDTAWSTRLMIMNASWQREGLAGSGTLRAGALGGKAPYKWKPVCGTYDMSKDLLTRDGLGMPIDLRNVPVLMVGLSGFPNQAFPMHCVITVEDADGQTDTVGITVPTMITGFGTYCYVRPPWLSRGQALPDQPFACEDPVMPTEPATAITTAIEPPSSVSPPGDTIPKTSPETVPSNNAHDQPAAAPASEAVNDGRSAQGRGLSDLSQGKFDAARHYLSESVASGYPVELSVVEHKALTNTSGTLGISRDEVIFQSHGKEIYRAPIAQISIISVGTINDVGPNAFYFDMSFEGKKHRFEYQPPEVPCSYGNGNNLLCDGNGLDQQRTIALWMRDVVAKYSSGATPHP